MLSRLMTRREQAVLWGLVIALVLGAVTLYVHDRRGAQGEVLLDQTESGSKPVPVKEPPIGVSVVGAVKTPGVYELAPGSRVQDGLTAAGGTRPDADLTDINLAAKLIDGTTLVIPGAGASGADGTAASLPPNLPQYTISSWRSAAPVASPGAAVPPGAPAPVASSPDGLIDLNTATQAELESLPGIGPVFAARIIECRTASPFRTVEDVRNVHGIGEGRLGAIRPFVTVRVAPPPSAQPAGR